MSRHSSFMKLAIDVALLAFALFATVGRCGTFHLKYIV